MLLYFIVTLISKTFDEFLEEVKNLSENVVSNLKGSNRSNISFVCVVNVPVISLTPSSDRYKAQKMHLE